MDKIYDESIDYKDLYLEEVINSKYFLRLKNSLNKELQNNTNSNFIKASNIFLCDFSDTFADTNKYIAGAYLRFILNDILNNQNFFLNKNNSAEDYKIMTTVSFTDIYENKINDNLDFEKYKATDNSCKNNNKSNIKLFDFDDEIIMEGVKEIHITNIEQFDTLMKYFFTNIIANK